MISRCCRRIPRFYNNFRSFIECSNVRKVSSNVCVYRRSTRSKNKLIQNLFFHRHNVITRFYSSYPNHVLIKLPNLSPTMETGTIVSWSKNEGDQVAEGDLLAEIETDKATMSFDASDSGILAKILVKSGTKDIPVGTPLCIMVEDVESVSAFKDYVPSSEAPIKTVSKPAKQSEQTPASPAVHKPLPIQPQSVTPVAARSNQPGIGGRIFVSPLARRMATEQGIDLAGLAGHGTGIHGMIRSTDLVGVQSADLTSQQQGMFSDLPVSTIRGVIAKRLTESKQTIPHAYFTCDVEMDQLIGVRSKINQDLGLMKKSDSPVKISMNDFFIKAVSLTCLKIPECNSAWHGDFIRQYNTVDVNVAVATPSGLITPIVFSAELKGLLQINQEMKELIRKAHENKLKPQEFQGGTFTLSNLGMFNVHSFNAIINPPQSSILAISSPRNSLLPDNQSDLGFRKATLLSVTLSCDHRVVDGAIAVQWLGQFKSILENPSLMLV